MDEIKLKISLPEARAIVEALRFAYGHERVGLEDTHKGDWIRLAERIALRLVRYEYAYGNDEDRIT